MADQMLRTLAHRLDIERRGDLPYPSPRERWRRAPVQNAVEINAAGGREPGIEVSRRRCRGENADRGGPQVMVDRTAEHRRICDPRQVDMRGLRQGMDAGISAPSAVHLDPFP